MKSIIKLKALLSFYIVIWALEYKYNHGIRTVDIYILKGK